MECPFIATCRSHRDDRISLGAELREDDGNELALGSSEGTPFRGIGRSGAEQVLRHEPRLPLRAPLVKRGHPLLDLGVRWFGLERVIGEMAGETKIAFLG